MRSAFTLIEVLVVVVIIGLLIGILAPSLSQARTQARLVVCATHLAQVGKGIMSYLQDSRDHMPYASYMPSFDPLPLDRTIFLADVLDRHIKQREVFQCPNDKPGFSERLAPNNGLSFFQSERSSYEYQVRLAGLTPSQFGEIVKPPGPPPPGAPEMPSLGKIDPNTVWILKDYLNFHGKKGERGAYRYLYIDGHVCDFEQY